ncbi:hypothetical protein CMV_015732 [Castanea mollissima]|uniref:NAD(P)-binding domain-containing protein n=1 Tax=Castanea mollissima TaxID=60419 RepID=A0A8J4VSC2_9ROSI|nr:hypothetical protein CMV_015732 [Castanea mollissima]
MSQGNSSSSPLPSESQSSLIAVEDSHTVEEFLQVAFGYVRLNWKDHVVIDKRYFRPTEVDNLNGDASRAKKFLVGSHD